MGTQHIGVFWIFHFSLVLRLGLLDFTTLRISGFASNLVLFLYGHLDVFDEKQGHWLFSPPARFNLLFSSNGVVYCPSHERIPNMVSRITIPKVEPRAIGTSSFDNGKALKYLSINCVLMASWVGNHSSVGASPFPSPSPIIFCTIFPNFPRL